MKIKKGDTIIVTAGKDKGKRGKVQKVFPEISSVIVAGINMYKRHEKRRDEKKLGGIIEYARPLKNGNIAFVCPSCHKATRIGFLVSAGDKYRVCRKCGQKI